MTKEEQKARKIVYQSIKDHDDGGYQFAGMNEILINRITQASKEQSESRSVSEKKIKQYSLEYGLNREGQMGFIIGFETCVEMFGRKIEE